MSEERKFLHDVANPLGIAMIVTEELIDGVKDEPETYTPKLMHERLQAVYRSLERIRELLKDRREILIQKDDS